MPLKEHRSQQEGHSFWQMFFENLVPQGLKQIEMSGLPHGMGYLPIPKSFLDSADEHLGLSARQLVYTNTLPHTLDNMVYLMP